MPLRDPAKSARACWSREISASIAESKWSRLMRISLNYKRPLEAASNRTFQINEYVRIQYGCLISHPIWGLTDSGWFLKNRLWRLHGNVARNQAAERVIMAAGSFVQLSVGAQVRELHIDFLLEEEFYSTPEFLRGFLGAAESKDGISIADASAEIESVRRSVSDAFGEADLIVVYSNSEKRRTAILIEDKLRAAFQPEQPERYAERGRAGIGKEWDAYWTCLVAPKTYISRGHAFDNAVSLESVVGLFACCDERRREFKMRVLQEAIRKCESNGVQVVDPVMTAFRKQYFAYFQDFFCDEWRDGNINTRPPAPTYSGDTWFEVRSTQLPRGAYINHKSTMGVVDLTFPNTNVTALEGSSLCLDADMIPVQTSKSAAIRIKVSPIKNFNDFDGEHAKVEEGLTAVRRLLDLYAREKARFQAVLVQPVTLASSES